MPIRDEDLKTIVQFKNLRKLNLSFTNISGAALSELAALAQLRHLSLSGTGVKWKDVQKMASLPKLSRLYLWNTAITPDELKQAGSQYKGLAIESGFKGDTVVLKLNPPLLENEDQIVLEPVPLKVKHFVKGVTIRYTTDGTEPDSVKSPVFNGTTMLDRNMIVKAKAYKEGWISSDVVERSFYKAGVKPDSVSLRKAPDPQYKGDGAVILMDAKKGDQDFRSGKWLGYKDSPLDALLYLKNPVELSSVSVSSLIDIGSSILPPHQVEVWGGNDPAHLRLLKRLNPAQPQAKKQGSLIGYDLSFAPATVKVVKVVVTPVAKLPAWHNDKGKRAWVFVDEVLLN
jgi:hypothetical protein